MSESKTNQTPTNSTFGKMKKTDVETDGFTGPVKQVMQTTYKAHLKAGTLIQGKIQSNYSSDKNNFITTYNEKGHKTQEQHFGKEGSHTHIFNAQGLKTEDIYNKEGKLYQKTTFTYNDKGNQLEHIVRNADGSLYFKVITKYNDEGKQLENIHYHGDESIFRKTLYQYDEKGNQLSCIEYDKDGGIDHQYLHKYNEQGKRMEEITEYPKDPKSQFNRRITYQYNEHGDTIETIFYKADGSVNSSYTHDYKYNEFGQLLEDTNYSDGRMDTIRSHKYNHEGGQLIETVYRNANGGLRSNVIYEYDKEQCTKETHYKPDGSIDRIVIYTYDPQGNRIETNHLNADGSPYNFVHPKAAGETEELENDSHGNWIKKTTFYNKLPVNIYLRQITYFGEQTPNSELQHPLINSTETDIEDTSNQTEELSVEQAKWLAEGIPTPDNFSPIRYYALLYNEAPSLRTYTGPYIEATALLHELKENMQAQEIHSYDTVWHGQGEQLQRYTLKFRQWGYLLHAAGISGHDADEFDVPENIKDNTRYYHDERVWTSQFQLLRPSDASGKRDAYFEEELQEYISLCSMSKKPDKPVINMIEVRGNSFAMVEHAADDDFEIKDLDVNYGYGFAKFHDELMQRFNTSTKGLVLFHGEPGTGKTYYIRHLLRKMISRKKVVIYMPPNMVDHLVEPGFMTFLTGEIKDWANDGFFSVLLIEDAEPLLAKRQEGVRIQGVTNLLNMSDGLLNDMLNLQIICTFNVDLKKLDSALLRPGRLIARKEFKKLSELDANLLAQRLGIKHHFKKPATLGEVYALLKNKNTLIHDVEPERDASTPIDDL